MTLEDAVASGNAFAAIEARERKRCADIAYREAKHLFKMAEKLNNRGLADQAATANRIGKMIECEEAT